MICPKCSSGDTHVIYSKNDATNCYARRRRECNQCKFRFNTVEVDLKDLDLIRVWAKKQNIDENGEYIIELLEKMIPDTLKDEGGYWKE